MSSTGSNDDVVLTVNKKDKKKKLRKRKRAEAQGSDKKRRIKFDLAHNMTREFHKHAKVMTRSLKASKDRLLATKPAIKRESIEQY
jgi:hypothetical protein